MRAAAHDINHWLTIIAGQCELGRREALKGDVAATLARFARIEAGVNDCAKIIKARVFTPAPSDVPSGHFDLNHVARKVAAEVADELDKAGIVLRLELAPAALMIAGDSLLMARALLNICINARDAINAANVTQGKIDIVTRLARAEQKAAVLEIFDNGIGMMPGAAWRATFDSEPADGEHGHGLRIVRKTVAQFRGWIDVKTALNEGTTFSIFLPLRVA